jgi:SAM-dependent methyltransferase
MQYEPIKFSLGRFISGSVCLRKSIFLLLDMLLLRSWHVRKTLRRCAVELPSDASVLDAGSGMGQYTWFMSKRYKRWRIDGIDINSEQIEDCNNFFKKTGLAGRILFKIADLKTYRSTDKYNLILSVDVMEHIDDDVTVFRNFFQAMKDNGILIISTPSDKGGSDVHSNDDKSFIDEHVRDGYNINEIGKKLTDSGFKKVSASYTYGLPGHISWILSMKYPIKMLNTSYLFFLILPLYYLVFFPLSLILNFIDLCTIHKAGTGLIITARK